MVKRTKKEMQQIVLIAILIIAASLFGYFKLFAVAPPIRVCEGTCPFDCDPCRSDEVASSIRVGERGVSSQDSWSSVNKYCNAWNRPSLVYSKQATCEKVSIDLCGDGVCSDDENHFNCRKDCPVQEDPSCVSEGSSCGYQNGNKPECCGNLECQFFQCVNPVKFYCGDGICQHTESWTNCPKDCERLAVCGDGICGPGETWGATFECAQDCYQCGDGVCEVAESVKSSPYYCEQDCKVGFFDWIKTLPSKLYEQAVHWLAKNPLIAIVLLIGIFLVINILIGILKQK